SVEAVSREIAIPADEILAAATTLLSKTPPGDKEAIQKLKQILAGVRAIKQSIQTVGETIASPAINAGDAALAAKLHGRRVLIVDADEATRRSAHALLGKYGCQVEAARTAAEAIDLATNDTYDAVLLDIRLPDRSA